MFILRKNMVAGYWTRTLSNAYRAFWSHLQLVFQPVSSSGRSPFLPGTTNVLWLSSHYFHPEIHLHPAQFLALTAGGTEKETLWKQCIVGSYLGLSCFSIPSSQEALEQPAVPIRLSCPWALKNNSLLSIILSFLFFPSSFYFKTTDNQDILTLSEEWWGAIRSKDQFCSLPDLFSINDFENYLPEPPILPV